MSNKDFENMKGIFYECVRCGFVFDGEQIVERGGEIKCPDCGYRVIKKVKPPIVKKVKAI